MQIRQVEVDELEIDGEDAVTHVGVYHALKRWMTSHGVHFGLIEGALAPEDDARLVNLAFWRPDGLSEVLDEPILAADQLAHNAWHQCLAHHLGAAATSPRGLLFVEAVASAFDLYLVGRVLGHHPDADLLITQVPAMREAAEAAGADADDFEAILAEAHASPEASFEQLRQLLFDTTVALLRATDPDAAVAALEAASGHPLAPLLHHYELPTWLLYARAYGADVDDAAVTSLDAALRVAADPIAHLEAICV